MNPAVVTPPMEFLLDGSNLEAVSIFCYLGDMIGDNGGCFDATTARIKSAWKKFRELLPILTNRGISLKTRGSIFSSAVRRILLHASETWAVTVEDCNRLLRTDNAMIRWICSTRLIQKISTSQLRERLGILSLEDLLMQSRLRWFGHIRRMDDQCWPKKVLNHTVEGKYKRRPKKRWMDNIKADMKSINIDENLTADRAAWRSAIKRGRRPTPDAGNNGR